MIPSEAHFSRPKREDVPSSSTHPAPPAYLLSQPSAAEARDSAGSQVEIWGLSVAERLERSLLRAGCPRVVTTGARPEEAPTSGTFVLCRDDAVLDERLVARLVETPGTVLLAPSNGRGTRWPVAAHVDAAQLEAAVGLVGSPVSSAPLDLPPGLRAVSPEELSPAYVAALRKTERPYAFFPVTADQARRIEDHLFAAAYKGSTDLVTKWVWPVPAAALTRALARRRIPPNAVTAASWVLAVLAGVLFYAGAFAPGLLAAWLMTFLDTVDGKLARCTLTSSRFGHVFDHGLDLIHPPLWWLAWGLGLPPGTGWATAITVGGYLVGRLLEGLFLLAFKIETHSWRPVDAMFRTITARRNPNLLLLSVATVGGRPDLGMVMVALWTLASLAFHTLRLLQAALRHLRGETIEPWNESGRGLLRLEEGASSSRGSSIA